MTRRIAVLGSNSFSGSHFVAGALGAGFEVVGISRSPEPSEVFLPYRKSTGVFRFHRLDLNHDLDGIMKLLGELKPEYVVNFAAQSMVAESWDNPGDWFRTNTLATIEFHDRLRKCDFLKAYLHVSTPEVYGSREGLVGENTSYNPTTPYAVSRAAADMSLMTFFKTYRFPVIFTRASNVYGPGQQLYRIIPRAILSFFLKKKLPLHGGGTSTRSFIHIRDVVDGTLRALEKGKPGEIYHLSTTRIISVRELVEMIAGRMDVSFEENVEVVGERLGKDKSYQLDSSKAREELGWSDLVSLEQGIDETIEWVGENRDELAKMNPEYAHKP